ncbi:hypothetical protein AVEN_88466-1 [Araneus ventricosus]|uniref:ATP-dependent DNA helicase n=1 Tax=Araneus ventricosus TaxID=182803 RepID=A0A4Y2JG85_ARAVE|nr:hypothetical protein AVEN_88466-1 [Araneus ventricosus]
MSEAMLTSSPDQIRNLFSIILTTCNPSSPRFLWDKFRESMSEDFLARVHQNNVIYGIQFSSDIFNKVLIVLESKCMSICSKTLSQLGLQSPERNLDITNNADLLREKNYNTAELGKFVEPNKPLLTDDQRKAYDYIMECINKEKGGISFLDAPGGTGKTFLINLLLAEIRSKNKIALAMAFSGIAATLRDCGRTPQSALKLPLNINVEDYTVCNISKASGQAKVLQTCKISVWDECTMAHKKSLEALDRTLRDLRKNDQLLGGSLLLLAGDFRQPLPVIIRHRLMSSMLSLRYPR